MEDPRPDIIEIVRSAVALACRQLGGCTRSHRATIAFFAFIAARAGNTDVASLAAIANAKAEAEPDILKSYDRLLDS